MDPGQYFTTQFPETLRFLFVSLVYQAQSWLQGDFEDFLRDSLFDNKLAVMVSLYN